jgi:hypothetical protein
MQIWQTNDGRACLLKARAQDSLVARGCDKRAYLVQILHATGFNAAADIDPRRGNLRHGSSYIFGAQAPRQKYPAAAR